MQKYTNPLIPGSFSGIAKFKQNNKRTNTQDVTTIPAYVLHKGAPTVFNRVRTVVPNVNSQWQIDLLDIKNKNLPFNFLLTVIDVFSRYAFVEPVKTKSSENVAEAFRAIFKRNRPIPQVIYSDAGNE